MEPAKCESGSLVFAAGSYNATVAFAGKRINIRAYSELAGKLFEAVVTSDDMSTADKEYFADCAGLFEMVEECVADKRKIELSDTGELKFHYTVKLGRKNEVARSIDFNLREVEIGEVQKLSIKVDRLEA